MSWGRSVAMSAVIVTTVFHKVLRGFAAVTFEKGVGSDLSVNKRKWCLSKRRYFIDGSVLFEFCDSLVKSFNH